MHRLRSYFYSGWAFCIPYLVLYLFYYALKLPVNPGSAHLFPSLLHLYWILHALHLVLGLAALQTWWRTPHPAIGPRSAVLGARHFGRISRIISLLPWLLLALYIHIPGAYFEWPSDPWMHYWRINAWFGMAEVGSHEFWFKSSYFFTYSWLRLVAVDRQFFWLGVYYTGVCLLLCWQYFRLARSVGLGARAAFLFVLLQVSLLGNSVFSFYRYYGISTTIFAQIGAMALIRVVYEFARRNNHEPGFLPEPRRNGAYLLLFSPWVAFVSSAFCLTLLVAFNHAQGLGLIALGIAAVAVWRVLQWKRALAWYLAAGALGLSFAAIHWWPRHPAIDQAYLPSGMFAFWYGFNVFSFQSPAGNRMLDILGFTGMANVAAGVLLILKRNHIAGWLTIMPFLGLSLPFIAIPFAGVLAGRFGHSDDIISFARMFLAIPAGLAIVCLGQELRLQQAEVLSNRRLFFSVIRLPAFLLIVLALLVLLTVPVGRPWYNRFWNAVAATPGDLRLNQVARAFAASDRALLVSDPAPRLITTPAAGYVATILGIKPVSPAGKPLWDPVVANADVLRSMITSAATNHSNRIVLILPPRHLYTPVSLAGQLSGHWMPQVVALDRAAGPELESVLHGLALRPTDGAAGTYYISGKPANK